MQYVAGSFQRLPYFVYCIVRVCHISFLRREAALVPAGTLWSHQYKASLLISSSFLSCLNFDYALIIRGRDVVGTTRKRLLNTSQIIKTVSFLLCSNKCRVSLGSNKHEFIKCCIPTLSQFSINAFTFYDTWNT